MEFKNRYTVVYVVHKKFGTLVGFQQVTLNANQSLTDVLNAAQIDPDSLVNVFHGHCMTVAGNWSDIKGEKK